MNILRHISFCFFLCYGTALFAQTIPIVIGEEIPDSVPRTPLPIPPAVIEAKPKARPPSPAVETVKRKVEPQKKIPPKTKEELPIPVAIDSTQESPVLESEFVEKEPEAIWEQTEESSLQEQPIENLMGDFALAQQKELKGKLDEAIALYKKVVSLQNENTTSALYRLAFLEARMGKQSLTNEAEFANDEEKVALYYFQASGFESRFLDNPQEHKWLDWAMEAYQKTLQLGEILPWSSWAKLRMARLYFNRQNYDSALQILLSSMNMPKNSSNAYQDLSWFLLARILHVSQQHYDPLRAVKAYQKVLDFPESLYYQTSRGYLQELEKKYSILP